jgi:hypothetical protein
LRRAANRVKKRAVVPYDSRTPPSALPLGDRGGACALCSAKTLGVALGRQQLCQAAANAQAAVPISSKCPLFFSS